MHVLLLHSALVEPFIVMMERTQLRGTLTTQVSAQSLSTPTRVYGRNKIIFILLHCNQLMDVLVGEFVSAYHLKRRVLTVH